MDIRLEVLTKDCKTVFCEIKVIERPLVGEYINVVDIYKKRNDLFRICKIIHNPVAMTCAINPPVMTAQVTDTFFKKTSQEYLLNGWFIKE